MTSIITNPAFAKGAGLMSDLQKDVSLDEIRRLERLGYIENAISPKGPTWKLSAIGKRSRDLLMDKRSWFDVVTDFIYRYIFHYHVSL